MPLEVVPAIRSALRAAADPSRATGMRAYMKSAMPFLGVSAPLVRTTVTAALAELPLDSDGWRPAVLSLWREAAFREERYAAIELAKRFGRQASGGDLALYEELVVTGAWWDLVDPVSQLVGSLLHRDPETLAPIVRAWSHDRDLWKRRTAIICQRSLKDGTDLDLLYACIEPNLADPEFFIRKAIGWALRSYAWHDPREVERYVREHEAQLSPLSRREAAKNLARLLATRPQLRT
jgi:3-methyladenine DNA glycosylase AlkD